MTTQLAKASFIRQVFSKELRKQNPKKVGSAHINVATTTLALFVLSVFGCKFESTHSYSLEERERIIWTEFKKCELDRVDFRFPKNSDTAFSEMEKNGNILGTIGTALLLLSEKKKINAKEKLLKAKEKIAMVPSGDHVDLAFKLRGSNNELVLVDKNTANQLLDRCIKKAIHE